MRTLIIVLGASVYGIALLIAGYQGIQFELGPWWASGALALAFVARITLPMVVGAFFGAWHVWHWHWGLALVFAVPGLLLIIPALVTAAFDKMRMALR